MGPLLNEYKFVHVRALWRRLAAENKKKLGFRKFAFSHSAPFFAILRAFIPKVFTLFVRRICFGTF